MKFQTLGRKPQNGYNHIFNADTLTIKKGAPCVLDSLAANSARFGWGVKSIESLAAAEEGFFMGIATADIATKTEGDTIVSGYVGSTRVLINSRSASTAVWPSTTGILIGDLLDYITVVGVQAVSRVGAGSALSAANEVPLQAFESYGSTTTQASSITVGCPDTGLLYSTAFKKTIVKFM